MMTETKGRELLNAQTLLAQKVYALLLADTKTSQQVYTAYVHTHGSGKNFRVIEGCLNTLVGSGLVEEPEEGLFRKAPLKPAVIRVVGVTPIEPGQSAFAQALKEATVSLTTPPAPPPLPAPAALSERLIDLSLRMSAAATEIQSIAVAAEELAPLVEAALSENKAEVERARQLFTLLGSYNPK